jgi:two-component system phosphate regulon response regulator PhoB
MRSINFNFRDVAALANTLAIADEELPLPEGERVADGEWVLAVFEIGDGKNATAAAARGLEGGGDGDGALVIFERRDWKRLVSFARDEGSIVPAAYGSGSPSSRSEPHDTIGPGAPNSRDMPVPDSTRAPMSNSWKVPIDRMRESIDRPEREAPSRLLLVDDDADIREVVGAMLEAVGLVVDVAESAEEALERVRREPFDLLVLDWSLPGMSGLELCRTVRGEPEIAGTPILFLSAHVSSRDIVDAFASGADDYVAKPFRAPELGARIFGLLRRARMTRTQHESGS